MQASYTVERQGVVVFEGLKDNKMDTYKHMKQAILKRLHPDTDEGRIYAHEQLSNRHLIPTKRAWMNSLGI